MISFITDSTPNDEVESIIIEFCHAFVKKLRDIKKIYKAFYSLDDSHVSENDFPDIKENSNNLKFWVRELYWTAIEVFRERTEEERWSAVMAKSEIFRVIKKLSKGPLSREDLQKWFRTIFPDHNLDSILDTLQTQGFVFMNSIGQVTYVLLVKDVNIMRVPPDCIIDLEEDSPELSDLTDIYIDEVRDFFETYIPTPKDSLELFKLFAEPKIYNVISQLREGPLPGEKIFSMVSKESAEVLLDTLKLLETNDIIQTFSYSGVPLYLLKTDVILTASFPEYLQTLLPRESKDYVAQAYSHQTEIPLNNPSVGENLATNDTEASHPSQNTKKKTKKGSKLIREKRLNRDFEENSETSFETIKALQQDLLLKLDSEPEKDAIPKEKKKKSKRKK
ncbi:MAG: hypothetical protein KAR20_11605, partial [Candidatus Heimdallarchaeota archaeon]|nr:hypothetical protein [Candidatus Heimdallarchaeota archaeon]